MSLPAAFVLKGYPRLSETFIAQEILGLERRGLDIRLISLRHPTDTATHPVHAEIRAPVSYLPEYLHAQPVRVWRGWRKARKLQERTGQQTKTLLPSLALVLLVPSAVFVLTGMPLSWDMPTLQGFNFAGGTSVPPAFLALLVSLSIYHAAQIAEAVEIPIQFHFVTAPAEVRRERVLGRQEVSGEGFRLLVTPEMFHFTEKAYEAPDEAELRGCVVSESA